jgi:hypothetical protein
MNINTTTIPAIEIRHPNTDELIYTSPEQTISEFEVVTIDDNKRKIVMAHLRPLRCRPLLLWKDAEYDAAGDYTQAEVEARILEKLGEDPVATIVELIRIPRRR